jgi:hypothetical protein
LQRRPAVRVRAHHRRQIIDRGRGEFPREPAHTRIREFGLPMVMRQMVDHEGPHR